MQRYLSGERGAGPSAERGLPAEEVRPPQRGQVIAASLVLAALVAGVVGTSVGLVRANRSARAERAAKDDAVAKRQEAERNLAFATKGNEILGSVFAGLDPKANYATVAELRNALRDNLAEAVKELDGSAIGDPLEWRRCRRPWATPCSAWGKQIWRSMYSRRRWPPARQASVPTTPTPSGP